MKKIKVLLLMGGGGSEHEVSLSSGQEVLKNLNLEKYEVVSMVVKSGGVEMEEVKRIKPGVVFIALHGKYGEDGQIQKEFEKEGIRFTGSGSEACRLGMDKIAFKKFAKELKIIVPEDVDQTPCVVKPCKNGSSFGVSIVKNQNFLRKAIDLAKKYDDSVIIEEYIEGIEVSCGVIGEGLALPIIEICPKAGFFDYQAKYVAGKCEEIVPARISDEISKKIQEISSLVFKKMGCKGFARLDFIIKSEIPYLLEINMIPGLTPNSLLPKEAKAAGMSYSDLLDKMIQLALE